MMPTPLEMSINNIFCAIETLNQEVLDNLPAEMDVGGCTLRIVEKAPNGRYKCLAIRPGSETAFYMDWKAPGENGIDVAELMKAGFVNDV